MCTAVSFKTADHYFGRNLDLEYSYNESVCITPRNYPFDFRFNETLHSHYALIGMGLIVDGYPLYYDATNEAGLSMAGLNFPGNAVYYTNCEDKVNVAPFELIPWLLGQYASINDVKKRLERINIVNAPFSDAFPLSPLHWIISDSRESICVETMKDGMKIYDNPVGILTNNPPFDYHMYNLANYMNVTRAEPTNRFGGNIDILPYSRGMGSIGLPGDLSSASRFVKAAFTKLNSVCGCSESESISQFFHILSSVAQQKGCVKVGEHFEKTVYSSCCNTNKAIYYYTTYENSQITGIDMHREDLNGDQVISYPLVTGQQIRMEN